MSDEFAKLEPYLAALDRIGKLRDQRDAVLKEHNALSTRLHNLDLQMLEAEKEVDAEREKLMGSVTIDEAALEEAKKLRF